MEPEELRGDLLNSYGIDRAMLRFVLEHPDNSQEVRDYIERRIAAGNQSAVAMKSIRQAVGTW